MICFANVWMSLAQHIDWSAFERECTSFPVLYADFSLLHLLVESAEYKCLPWFNRQREKKYLAKRDYADEVWKEFKQRIGKVQGSRYIWAIRPTCNNSQYLPYSTGVYDDA